MLYGYTIADKADRKIFEETIRYMESDFGYKRDGPVIIDVDGSTFQRMIKASSEIMVESDEVINYVAITSEEALPITCLRTWVGKNRRK